MRRKATFGVFLLLMLVLPAFSAGYAAFATGPNGGDAASSGGSPGHSSHPAIRLPVKQGTSSPSNLSIQNSTNWSGFVIPSGNGSVTDVNGSWIVPSVTCSSTDSDSAFWVGIDGWNSDTVEQTGTDSDCLGGTPVYYAWYEFYPAFSVGIDNIPVSPGDVISASVSCQAKGLQCTVSIHDVSNSQSFSHNRFFRVGNRPDMSSAEWIAEAPSSTSDKILQLADFSTVNFGPDSTGAMLSDNATISGVSGQIGSFGAAMVELTMIAYQGGPIEAQPTGLSSDGTSFSVTWVTPPIPALTAGKITPVSSTIEPGASIQLNANPSAGTPPYSVTWYTATGAGNCSTSDVVVSTGLNYTATPTAGTYYCYVVTDSGAPPASAYSLTDLVIVGPTVGSPAISVTPSSIGIGQSALISTVTAFTNGNPPYTCEWLEESPSNTSFSALGSPFTSGCTTSSNPSASTGHLLESGAWAFELQVTDSLESTVVSPAETLSVSSAFGTVLTAACRPDPAVAGLTTRCEATVQGLGSTPTGRVAWSSNGQGKFSSPSCRLSRGACSVKFTPTAADSFVGLLASYGGDSSNTPSAGAYILNVNLDASRTTVSCTPMGVTTILSAITCKAKVAAYSPTGTVTWSQEGLGVVSFSGVPMCTLSKGACSVTMFAGAVGGLDINASYSGDPNNGASYAVTGLTIAKAKTTLSVSCTQKSLVTGASTTCAATVSGPYSSQTGTVAWSTGGGSGGVTFSWETCALSAGSCWVNVVGSAAGKVTIVGVYAGDPNNQGSSGLAKLTIK